MQGIVSDVLRRKQTEFMGKMEINDNGDGKVLGFLLLNRISQCLIFMFQNKI